jgi:arginase
MQSRPYAVLQAPSTLGLEAAGVEGLGNRLLELGLARDIHARFAGRLSVPQKQAGLDPNTGVLNAESIAAWSPKLADAVEAMFDAGEFPVVLGGDCTIVLGSMLACRRRGRYGLLFIDGNADFFQPEAEPHGEAASMDLAFVTGHGPQLLTDLEGLRPIVRARDVVAFAYRDHDDQKEYGSQPLPPELKAIDLPAVRKLGIEAAARTAVAHLTRPELDGFFIHVDADCLDDAVMPAVDFRVPGGLSLEELATALRIALASGHAIGLEVAIYNPRLDEDGSAGRALASVLREALRAAAAGY